MAQSDLHDIYCVQNIVGVKHLKHDTDNSHPMPWSHRELQRLQKFIHIICLMYFPIINACL